jgi:peptidylprolyl isomerase
MRRTIARLLTITALTLPLSLAACNEDPVEPTDPTDVTYAAELGVDLAAMTRTNSGLYYEDRVVGNGSVAAQGDLLSVRYRGWLPNGELFDSNIDAPQPFTFRLGVSSVIAGWHEGLTGTREGGTRLLVIPPWLGYGSQANGPIPGNSVLVFEVQIIGVS